MWKRSGSSANITSYRRGDGVWASVLCAAIEKVDGTWRAKKIPTYYITIYCEGEGEIGSLTYEPKTKPCAQELSPRTVGKLVNQVLA